MRTFMRGALSWLMAAVLPIEMALGQNVAISPPPSFAAVASFNGWAPIFGVRDDSPPVPVAGGANYAVGDQLFINAGCSHNPELVVASVTAGAVTAYNVVDKGFCSIVAPTSPFSVLSTPGTGTGATFNLLFAPLSANVVYTPSVTADTGNLFLTGTVPQYFSGTESVGVGYRPMWLAGAPGSSFNVAVGHNVEGGAGCNQTIPTYVFGSVAIGTDNLRNSCGHGEVTAIGVNVMKSYAQVGTVANQYATGNTGLGGNALFYWNAPIANPYNTAIGDSACKGNAVGTVQFSGMTCLGSRNGLSLLDATNSVLINGGNNALTAAGASLSSGSNNFLANTGQTVCDVPSPTTSNYLNINCTIIGTTQGQPSWVSGFNPGAGWTGVVSGQSSFRFGWNGGTPAGASTGVLHFPTAAPHGYDCKGRDKTSPASFTVDFSVVSVTDVSLTTYSRTTGLVAPYNSGDQFEVSCMGF
jgi:hypothetical protein